MHRAERRYSVPLGGQAIPTLLISTLQAHATARRPIPLSANSEKENRTFQFFEKLEDPHLTEMTVLLTVNWTPLPNYTQAEKNVVKFTT